MKCITVLALLLYIIPTFAKNIGSSVFGLSHSKLCKLRGGSKVDAVPDTENFDKALRDAGTKLVVVDFTASWCMPCKMISPVFEEMSEEEEFADVVFLKVDVDEIPDITERYQVLAMPTFVFIKEGDIVERFSGASVEKLRETLLSLLH
mmetsp:Transcript_3990/g.4073  ORF Transcript_3990/g.4073 Transcript_3990/m.4073 type:complete len:149 (+) Transcript_3990:78-524(+)